MDCKLFERLQLWIPEPGEVAGPYGIPIIRAQALPYVDEWRPFNDLSKPFDKNMGVSMYVDDYRIHRLWASPDRYVPILAKAGWRYRRTLAFTPICLLPWESTTITASTGWRRTGRSIALR